MNKTVITQITELIEQIIDENRTNDGRFDKPIIVYPCGDLGIQIINIMKTVYSMEPTYIIDNHKSKYSSCIHPISFLKEIDISNCILILASINPDIYDDLKKSAEMYLSDNQIYELDSMKELNYIYSDLRTSIGKYSYGPICKNHPLIESIGAFCSIAAGVDVVWNHEKKYITTHPMIYLGHDLLGIDIPYELYKKHVFYVEGIEPKAEYIKRQKRSIIGNDVWLGHNVIITNGANIGNGVIAGAGAVITKDVPDYAVVAGVPARIIRYRYSPEQIEALNRIAWWNWSDEEITKCWDAFYWPIEEFINRFDKMVEK